MQKINKAIVLGLSALVILAGSVYVSSLNKNFSNKTNIPSQTVRDKFFYKGQTGKDALILLKEKSVVEQDRSGLVDSINSRKAQASKHEFWAFYVNGKLAPVGPADYKTKDSDIIEWRIEKY